MTVQQMIVDAMYVINAAAVGETPSAAELSAALRTANVMLGKWSAQKLSLRADSTISFSLVAGDATYTIGSGAFNINTTKPIKIYGATITDSGETVSSVEVVTQGFYDSLPDRNIATGEPIYVAYDPGATQQATHSGVISFYPIPDAAYTCELSAAQYLTEFASLSDNITLEPAYYEALIYNLAVRLFRQYHAVTIVIPDDIVQIANNAYKTITNMNAEQVIAGFDFGASGGYNIYTDRG